MSTLTDQHKRKAIGALERRFGQSIMPYVFLSTPDAVTGRTHHMVKDTENGRWITFQIRFGRLAVTGEHDGSRFNRLDGDWS